MGNSAQLGEKITMTSWSNTEAGAQTVGSSRMEILKTSLPEQLDAIKLALRRGLDWLTSRATFPPQFFNYIEV